MTTYSSEIAPKINGTTSRYLWHWQGKAIAIAYEKLGKGDPVLLLPALSTVSSRAELATLANGLAKNFEVTVLDWPGFGDSERLRLNYGPDLLAQFLLDFVSEHFTEPVNIVAAGHATGYALKLQGRCKKLICIAPTWKGPLAVMGAPNGMRSGVRELVRSPLIGQFLYGLNTHPSFLKWMYRRHVFVDEAKLTPDFIAQRHQGTQKSGARYGPAAFVTGGLDPVQTREEFLDLVHAMNVPMMVLVGEQAPPTSKAEMEAIADAYVNAPPTAAQVTCVRMPGTLGMAEEFGEAVAAEVLPFLLTEVGS